MQTTSSAIADKPESPMHLCHTQHAPLPHGLPCRSNIRAYGMPKNGPSRPAVQGHSRLFDQLLPIIPIPDNFLLTFHSNLWPIMYHFQDTVRQAKYCKFLQTLVYLSSTSGGYP